MVFGSLIPSVVIVGSNLGIAITVRQASKRRTKMGVQKGDGDKQESQLTSMLAIVSAAYLITTVPYRLFYVVLEIPAIGDMYDMTDPYWGTLYAILLHFFFDLWVCNHAVNFYLYCLAGGKGYRQDTKKILSKLFCWKA
jgi:hypothetical protein